MRTTKETRKDGDIIVENQTLRLALFEEYGGGEQVLDEDGFSNPLTELKTHSWAQVQETGNFFIECEALFPKRNEFEPSGIYTTKAKYWVFNFKDDNGFKNDVVLMVKTTTLIDVIQRGLERGLVTLSPSQLLPTGDINKGYIVPIMLVLRELYYVTPEPVLEVLNKERDKWLRRKKKLMMEKLNDVRKKLFGKK